MVQPVTRSPLIVVTSAPGAGGGVACAAAIAVAAARRGNDGTAGVILAELDPEAKRRPTLVSSAAARSLEATLRGIVAAAARGAVCWVGLDPTGPWREGLELCRSTGAAAVVLSCGPGEWRELVDGGEASGAVVRAERDADRPLASLAANELIGAGVRAGVVRDSPGLVSSRRALAGIEPGGALGLRAERIAARLLRDQRGQALPLVVFCALVLVLAGLALAMMGTAATGASRLQRAADLAAVSAAREMRDTHYRLFMPAKLPKGIPNPLALSNDDYKSRAEEAAIEALDRNGFGEVEASVSFPFSGSILTWGPTKVQVVLAGEAVLDGEGTGREFQVSAVAEARTAFETGWQDVRVAAATGGGYSGRLAVRQGEGMRPDVAGAFDAMERAARADGHALTINSAFRSDAEQARLFAANPDPRMVARPGTSLHRCGTELDLGPPTAHGWLAVNAARFGFLKRYDWEPWHFGFTAGPPPCSGAGDRVSPAAARSDGRGSSRGLPSYVPERYRGHITRAASRWNVPAGLLAAQLMAESNFDPTAVSPAGALGIAQFMPGTAAAYGLDDPNNPGKAIDAQAHLMSDLLRQFAQIPLALAAYNAGPVPVAACGCVPDYPETQAYVTRIMSLMGGAGEIAPPQLDVRLVG